MVKIGFIGCGWVCGAHLEKLKNIPDAKVVAFYDPAVETAKNKAGEFGATAYQDYRAMIDKGKLDAVYVTIPPYAHGEIELFCAGAGLPMFIEKPVALNVETARTVLKSIKKNKIITGVGYQWRYSPMTKKAADLLKGRKIGMVIGRYFAFYKGGSTTWGLRAKSGGQTVEQATHIFDLARFLVGDVERVYCESGQRLLQNYRNFDISDVSAATLRFRNGTIGAFLNSCANVPLQVDLRIISEDLVLTHHNSRLEVWKDGKTELFEDKFEGDYYSKGFEEEDRIFVKAVREKDSREIMCDYEEAAKTLALTLAVEESAQNGAPIEIE